MTAYEVVILRMIKMKNFLGIIQKLSDDELGKSLNKMIKIRSEISSLAVDDWRRADTDHKIDIMQKEWSRRAENS